MKVKHISTISSIIFGSTLLTTVASATSTPLTWQDEVDVQFTFNPALSVTISDGDIVIPNLGVGTRDNSNEIAITVTTNNIAGYQLSATVGNASTYDYRELKHETTSTALFNSLAVGTTLNQLSTPSTWGYSTDSGTSYSGLPKYDDTTNVAVLNDSTASGTETTNFLIGAYADQNQLAGDYKNVINFNIVTNMVKYTIADAPDMQSVASGTDGCPSTLPTGQAYELTDSRDGEVYKVAKLAGGKCWLLDNLRLDLVAHKNDLNSSNTNASDTILGYLKNGGGTNPYPASGVAYATSSNSYNLPYLAIEGSCSSEIYCVNDPSTGSWNKDVIVANSPGSGSGKVGVYYNYCAASAGSYCYDSDVAPENTNATQDICPAGWRMPTGGSSGEYQALFTSYSSNGANFKSALSTPRSGNFYNGSASYQDSSGCFWSSTRSNGSYMYDLYAFSGTFPQHSFSRDYGNSVRCLLQ
ncbi:hypothetical protein IJ101_00130 [Candidatus Saccharibacteria bacterium]|nr:hypothetical protein [Candidatus Saccharibacteria bacterium]